jgi:hypothetical protein
MLHVPSILTPWTMYAPYHQPHPVTPYTLPTHNRPANPLYVLPTTICPANHIHVMTLYAECICQGSQGFLPGIVWFNFSSITFLM